MKTSMTKKLIISFILVSVFSWALYDDFCERKEARYQKALVEYKRAFKEIMKAACK